MVNPELPSPVASISLSDAAVEVSTAWSAMTPARTTATLLTDREAVELSSWRRRTASCHATGPPRAPPTSRSTIHGSRAGMLASIRTTEVVRSNGAKSLLPESMPQLTRAIPTRPSNSGTARHPSCLGSAAPALAAPSGSTATRRVAKRALPTASSGSPTTTTARIHGFGRMSSGNSPPSTIGRDVSHALATAKSSAPTSSPRAVPSRASPTASRRIWWRSAPSSRSAASRRMRENSASRVALATKTTTGTRIAPVPTA